MSRMRFCKSNDCSMWVDSFLNISDSLVLSKCTQYWSHLSLEVLILFSIPLQSSSSKVPRMPRFNELWDR